MCLTFTSRFSKLGEVTTEIQPWRAVTSLPRNALRRAQRLFRKALRTDALITVPVERFRLK